VNFAAGNNQSTLMLTDTNLLLKTFNQITDSTGAKLQDLPTQSLTKLEDLYIVIISITEFFTFYWASLAISSQMFTRFCFFI